MALLLFVLIHPFHICFSAIIRANFLVPFVCRIDAHPLCIIRVRLDHKSCPSNNYYHAPQHKSTSPCELSQAINHPADENSLSQLTLTSPSPPPNLKNMRRGIFDVINLQSGISTVSRPDLFPPVQRPYLPYPYDIVPLSSYGYNRPRFYDALKNGFNVGLGIGLEFWTPGNYKL